MLFIRQAIELSQKSLSNQGLGPFGAIIVRDNQIIGQGWNQVVACNDPTAHAEIIAIRDACLYLATFNLQGCTLYSSCEPCPMCLGAAYWARLDSIVYGATRQDAAEAGFDDEFFYQDICSPPAARTIHMQQDLRDEAKEVLRHWAQASDRTRY
ncbi:tRNA(Arg) A34 adenosine deaminase TadA [Geoalkalibacter ferrihydriticus]|uniref:tRNA(Arg) A34 adenosine deaminase TadA n=1 Tax=Geoalkalibacter ferrihydriticus TaxID=392333 RepID=A0A1G9V748_9BACT|nr:nucleoside deaminase [Geoalkalibacter ferrihydriticus]SDM68018.1 tRNA(Arg) A34 adenosine deaminase TadA [Geoalkalibacter ferrihydriticus]